MSPNNMFQVKLATRDSPAMMLKAPKDQNMPIWVDAQLVMTAPFEKGSAAFLFTALSSAG